MLTAESASEGLHAIHIHIIYNAWNFCIIYSFGVKDVPCMHYMQLNALTAHPLNQRRRHWPLRMLLIVQWQMHTDRAGIYVYNPGHIVTGNSGEYIMYL